MKNRLKVFRLYKSWIFWIGMTGGVLSSATGVAQDMTRLRETFDRIDNDNNGHLSREEFWTEVGSDKARRSEVIVFDFDQDGSLSFDEFRSIPRVAKRAERGDIPDRVRDLAERGQLELKQNWRAWDKNTDNDLNAEEFTQSSIQSVLAGLQTTEFTDWDRNNDHVIQQPEAMELINIACGLIHPSGVPLRTPAGLVVQYAHFDNCDNDDNLLLNQTEFVAGNGNNEEAAELFRKVDLDQDGHVSLSEWGQHAVHDLAADFLARDADFSGTLAFEEVYRQLPAEMQFLSTKALQQFDDNHDGQFSLAEYTLLPQFNMVLTWHAQRFDTNGDGHLDFGEFHWIEGPAITALRGEYFRRLDVNQNGTLQLEEWRFRSGNPEIRLAAADSNGDGVLSFPEYQVLAGGAAEVALRDFRVFDFNGDEALSVDEMAAIPALAGPGKRGPLPDPVMSMIEGYQTQISSSWSRWDQNGDQVLSATEFKNSDLRTLVAGLEDAELLDWDEDQNQSLTATECRRLIEIALGVRSTTGTLLRRPSGVVVQFAHFQNCDGNHDQKLSEKECILGNGGGVPGRALFTKCDRDHDKSVSLEEWSQVVIHDVVGSFLGYDVDLNSQVSLSELQRALPSELQVINSQTFSQFDSDHNGQLSLPEYLLLPEMNLILAWHFPRNDTDFDGHLSMDEFSWHQGWFASALRTHYFKLLDVDRSGFLEFDELRCNLDPAKAPPEIVFRSFDLNEDSRLTLAESLPATLKTYYATVVAAPQSSGPANPQSEVLLARHEEAFQAADSNQDGFISATEFETTAGRELVAPGSMGLATQSQAVLEGVARNTLGIDPDQVRMGLIVLFNIVVVAGICAISLRKPKTLFETPDSGTGQSKGI